MKALALASLLLLSCDLPSTTTQAPAKKLRATAGDGGVFLAPADLPCCAVDGTALVCPPEGVWCRDCRQDSVGVFCCGIAACEGQP